MTGSSTPAAVHDRLPDPMPIPTASAGLRAVVRPPGSKSITNRVLLMAALASGRSRISGALRSDDCDRLLAALASLGIGVEQDGDDLVIEGGAGRLPQGGAVDLGDGGTPARFMLAAAALATAPVVVDGSPRMRERPVAELAAFLRTLGAVVESLQQADHLPLRITRGRLDGGALRVPPTASSQFVSALLLVAPHLDSVLELTLEPPVTSAGYIDATCRVLLAWGVAVTDATAPEGVRTIRVEPCRVAARDARIPVDASSATYWLTAGAIIPRAAVTVDGLGLEGLDQPDAGYARMLERFGARCTTTDGGITVHAPAELVSPGAVDMAAMPDAAMSLAVVAARARGATRITGLATLRVKESDRIAALAAELARVGCGVEAEPDALVIRPGAGASEPATIRTYDDHRIAMAFAVLGLVRPGLSIADPGCVAKSYPGFWNDFRRMLSQSRTTPESLP